MKTNQDLSIQGIGKKGMTKIFRVKLTKSPDGKKDVNDYRAEPDVVKSMLRKAIRIPPTNLENKIL